MARQRWRDEPRRSSLERRWVGYAVIPRDTPQLAAGSFILVDGIRVVALDQEQAFVLVLLQAVGDEGLSPSISIWLTSW